MGGRSNHSVSVSSTTSSQPLPMSLLDRLGGVAGTSHILDEFSRRVEQDEQLFAFFNDTKVTFFRLHQLKVFRMTMDNDVRGHSSSSLVQNHLKLFQNHGLSVRHFDLMIHHLLESLNTCKVDESLYRDASDELWSLRGAFVRGVATATAHSAKGGSLQTVTTAEDESLATSNNSHSTSGTAVVSKGSGKIRRRLSNLFRTPRRYHQRLGDNDPYSQIHGHAALPYTRVKRSVSGDVSIVSEISEISGPNFYPPSPLRSQRRLSTGAVLPESNVHSTHHSAANNYFPPESVHSVQTVPAPDSPIKHSLHKSHRRLSTGCIMEESSSNFFPPPPAEPPLLSETTPPTQSPVPVSKEQRYAQWNAMVAELAARTKAERALQHIQLDPCPTTEKQKQSPFTQKTHLPTPVAASSSTAPTKRRFSFTGAARRFSNGSGRASRRRSSNGGSSGSNKVVRRFSNGIKSRLMPGSAQGSRRRASVSGTTVNVIPEVAAARRFNRRASTGVLSSPVATKSPIPFPSSPTSREFLKEWSVIPDLPLATADSSSTPKAKEDPVTTKKTPKMAHLYFE